VFPQAAAAQQLNVDRRLTRPPNLAREPARRLNAQTMAATLTQRGVRLEPAVVQQIAQSSERLNGLHSLDLAGRSTAFEHILRIASAGTLKDGTPAAPLAAELFALAGTSRRVNSGKCYSRANHTLFSKYYPGEFARLVGDLAVGGQTRLANGEIAKWNTDTWKRPANLPYDEFLWYGLNTLAKNQALPANGEIYGMGDNVYDGEMANLQSRLFGIPYVNVGGAASLQHLDAIIRAHQPLLTEYGNAIPGKGNTAGALARVVNDKTYSMNEGGDFHDNKAIGYVAVPAREAAARRLTVLQYATSTHGYLSR
jgi:hypothetical protein